jgi:hypothetical protein
VGVEEPETIASGLTRDESFAEIARRRGRPTSTVAREVGGCGGRLKYLGRAAQRQSLKRAQRAAALALVAHRVLAAVVAQRLKRSPSEVAARVLPEYPNDEAMRVSYETIYVSLYRATVAWRGADCRSAIGPDPASTPPLALAPGQLAQHVGEDPAVPVVLGLHRGVDADPGTELGDRAVVGHCLHGEL